MKKIISILALVSLLTTQAFAYWPSAEDIQNMIKNGMPNGTNGPDMSQFEDMQKQWQAQWLSQMKAGIATFKASAEKWKIHMEKCKENGCTGLI